MEKDILKKALICAEDLLDGKFVAGGDVKAYETYALKDVGSYIVDYVKGQSGAMQVIEKETVRQMNLEGILRNNKTPEDTVKSVVSGFIRDVNRILNFDVLYERRMEYLKESKWANVCGEIPIFQDLLDEKLKVPMRRALDNMQEQAKKGGEIPQTQTPVAAI